LEKRSKKINMQVPPEGSTHEKRMKNKAALKAALLNDVRVPARSVPF
jgi:hypothetical protein